MQTVQDGKKDRKRNPLGKRSLVVAPQPSALKQIVRLFYLQCIVVLRYGLKYIRGAPCQINPES